MVEVYVRCDRIVGLVLPRQDVEGDVLSDLLDLRSLRP